MPLLIVGNEKNLSQLKSRLFEGRVSRASLAKVNAAVKAANPGVDLSRLRPGVVLTIPDMTEVKIRGDFSIDDIAKRSIDQASEQFAAALESAGAASAAALKRSRADRARISKAVGSRQVAKAARSDKALAAEIRSTRAALAAQDELDSAREESTNTALEKWSNDLDGLRSLANEQ